MKIFEKKEKNRQNCGVIQTKIRKMIDMVRKKTDIYKGNNTETEKNRHKIRKYNEKKKKISRKIANFRKRRKIRKMTDTETEEKKDMMSEIFRIFI